MPSPEVELSPENTSEESKDDVEIRRKETEAKIKRKDLFSDGGSFSRVLGGSKVDSAPTSHQEINGIEFVEFSNPNTGDVDVVMTGTSDTDYVGYYRIYENGKPTNKWSSKFENQSRNKENFKTMISNAQLMLPKGHEYTEKTSISTDGLRVWGQQLSRGYDLQYDNFGNIVTNRVSINGDAITNELGVPVDKGGFTNISVTDNAGFESVKKALTPYLEKLGLSSDNVYWSNGSVEIDLPILRSGDVAQKLGEPQITEVEDGQLLEWRTKDGLIGGVLMSPTEFRIDGISATEVGKGLGSKMFESLIGYLKEKGVKTLTSRSAGDGAVTMHDKAVKKGLLKEISKDGRNATFEIVNESLKESIKEQPTDETALTAEPSFASSLGETKDLSDIAEGQEMVTIGDADVTLSEKDGVVTLEKIRVAEGNRKKGAAKAALEVLTKEADKQGKEIALTIKPEGKGVTKEGLRKLYEKAGFVGEGDAMTRKPQLSFGDLGGDPDLKNISPDIVAARNGDKEAQKQFEDYGVEWEQTTTYRFVGKSEVDVLLSNEKVESKRGMADNGIDVTSSPKITTANNGEYRVTFKESFDKNNGLKKVRAKNETDSNLEKGRGYVLSDVAKIEKIDADGNVVELIYETSTPKTNEESTTQSESNPVLRDVESTSKALAGIDDKEFSNLVELKQPNLTKAENETNALDLSFNEHNKRINDANEKYKEERDLTVAEAYHKAKGDGTNPELVKAVESILSKEQPTSTTKPTVEQVGDKPTSEGAAKEETIKISENETENELITRDFTEEDNIEQEPSVEAVESKAASDSKEQRDEAIAEADALMMAAMKVVSLPLSEIVAVPEVYQPRKKAFSEKSAKKVHKHFDPIKFEPIIVYKEPSGRTVVLSGHSRFEGVKRRGLTSVPVKFFEGTPAEAKEFAHRANKDTDAQSDIENAEYYRNKRQEGASHNAILIEAKENEQSGSASKIIDFSYLNPRGKAVAALEQIEESGDSKRLVEGAAQRIGQIRRMNEHLTDSHEDEMFEHFLEKATPSAVEISDSNSLINRSIAAAILEPAKPLNLAKFVTMSDARKEWTIEKKRLDAEVAALKKEVNPDKKTNRSGLKALALQSLIGKPDATVEELEAAEVDFENNKDGIKDNYEKLLAKKKQELSIVQSKLANHIQSEQSLRKGDRDQGSLFQSSESKEGVGKEIISAITERIEKTFAKVFGTKVKILSGEDFDNVLPEGAETISSSDSDILGFVTEDGSIILNGDKLNANTPIHEAGHLWNRWAKQNRPELYKMGLNKVNKSPYYYAVKRNPFYQEQAKDMTPEQREEFFLEEALATAIGDAGEQMVTENKKNDFKAWLQELWNSIADFLGIERMSMEEIQKMTMEEFAKRVAASILSGEQLEGFVDGSFMENYMAEQRRKFDESIEDNTTSESLLNMVMSKPSFYTQISDDETIQEAVDLIEKSGHNQAYADIVSGDAFKRVDDLRIATAASFMLMDKYSEMLDGVLKYGEGDNVGIADFLHERVKGLHSSLVKNATHFGQAVQVHARWKVATPLTQLFDIEKALDLHNSQLVRKKTGDKDSKGKGVEDTKAYKEALKEAENLREQLAEAQKKLVDEIFKKEAIQEHVNRLLEDAQENTTKAIEQDQKQQTKKTTAKKTTPKSKAPKKAWVAAEKVKEAKQEFDDALKMFMSPGDTLMSSFVPFTNNQLVAIGNMTKALVKQGYYQTSIIADEIVKAIKKQMPNVDPDEITKIVDETISNDAEASELVDKNYEQLTKTTIKQLGEDLKDIFKEHTSKRDAMKQSLAEKIADKLGFTNEDAAKIAKALETILQKAAQAYIDAKYKGKEKKVSKARETVFQSFVTSVGLGVLNDDALMIAFTKQYGLLPGLTTEQKNRVLALAEAVQLMEYGSEYYVEAVRELVKYTRELMPEKTWETVADFWIGANYASILSGWSTHLVNVLSVQASMRAELFNDLVNFDNHFRSAFGKAMTKEDWDTVSNLPDFIYRNVAGFFGIRNQGRKALRAFLKGASDNKFVESVNNTTLPFNMSPLERNKFKYVPYKFVGRALDAEDTAMRQSLKDRYLAEEYRRIIAGMEDQKAFAEVFKEVNAAMNFSLLEESQRAEAEKMANEEAALFEKTTGIKIGQGTVTLRAREIMRNMVNGKLGLTPDKAAELMAEVEDAAELGVFRGDRHGTISWVASGLSAMSNSGRVGKILTMPFMPFTKTPANVGEFMLDAAPLYGLWRAYMGGSVSVLIDKARTVKKGNAKIENRIARRKQMGRAWAGTIYGTALLWLTALGDDEDPLEKTVYITGSMEWGEKYKEDNPALLPYTVYVNAGGTRYAFNYKNMPGMNMLLNHVGSYNDFMHKSRLEPKKERMERGGLILQAMLLDQKNLYTDFSFLGGVQQFFDLIGAIATGKPDRSIGDDTREQSDVDNVSPVSKEFVKSYLPIVTNPLPWNFNAVKQTDKLFNHNSYSRKSLQEIINYDLGTHYWNNAIRTDVFGEKVKGYPGENFLAWEHYFSDRKNDPRWKFLLETGFTPAAPKNREIKYVENGKEVTRNFNADEYSMYSKLAGESFAMLVEMTMDDYSDKRMKNDVERKYKVGNKMRSAVYNDMQRMATLSRDIAKDKVVALINMGQFDAEYKKMRDELKND